MKVYKKDLRFDKQFFKDFWELVKPYWRSEEKWVAFLLLALTTISTVVSIRAMVALNEFNKEFYDALLNFNKSAVTTALLHFAVIITAIILSFGYVSYFNGLLSIRWRRWLTKNSLNKWLQSHNHYRMQLNNNNVDNADQRISEDIESFPTVTLTLFFFILQSLLSIISFGYVLWNLSSNLSIPIGISHVAIPGYLFWGALLYGILGTLITAWIGKKLAGLDYQQQYFNADFRFALVRFRESSEQIAMYKGESVENEKFIHLFSRIFNNYLNINSLRKRLTFFSNGYNNAGHLIGVFMAIPFFLQKKIQFGSMMQISGAFGSVVSGFSMLINGFTMFTLLRAVVSRLTEFNKSMATPSQGALNLVINEHESSDIVADNLKLLLPEGDIILNEINLTFHAGGTFLLCGKSGLGKSTLLRVLARLWPYAHGEIRIPKNKAIFFLPQKPYLPLGSLKEILLYPNKQDVSLQDIYHALAFCQLTKFQHKLAEEKNWALELSLGEQQLIALARIFLHRPDIVFLDESTSALDEKTETHVYKNLRMFLPQATIISVGHRSNLRKLHEHIIMLSKDDVHPLNEKFEIAKEIYA